MYFPRDWGEKLTTYQTFVSSLAFDGQALNRLPLQHLLVLIIVDMDGTFSQWSSISGSIHSFDSY